MGALRDERGIDVSRLLNVHEYVLLEREVADWVRRAQGGQGQGLGLGRGKGMAERLALAADAALHQKGAMSAATPERPRGVAASQDGARGGGESAVESTATAAAAAAEEGHRGGIPNASRRHLPVAAVQFPMVVVEGGPSSTAERSGHGLNTGDAASRVPTAATGGAGEGTGARTATSRPQKSLDRQLDLLGVALDAHEVCTAGATYT